MTVLVASASLFIVSCVYFLYEACEPHVLLKCSILFHEFFSAVCFDSIRLTHITGGEIYLNWRFYTV